MTLSRTLLAVACLFFALAYAQQQRAGDPAYSVLSYEVKAHYTKSEIMIPMRDGVKLFTIVYAPRDHSQKYPFLLTRTAYGIAPYGPDNYRGVIGPNNEFAKEGYIVVYQDTRGKFKS